MISNKSGGFTLVELMVVVVVISILSAVAIPAYKDYVIRAKITQAISWLSSRQVGMEQCYQDNRTYENCAVCATTVLAKDATVDFTFDCGTPAETTFTLTATGQGAMDGFGFTVNQSDAKSTASVPPDWQAPNPNSCWVTRKGGKC
jgi:type IV pilus assembly protein PilE